MIESLCMSCLRVCQDTEYCRCGGETENSQVGQLLIQLLRSGARGDLHGLLPSKFAIAAWDEAEGATFAPHSEFGDTSVFQCQRCGGCCRDHGYLNLGPGDIRRWILEKRTDILQHAYVYLNTGEICIFRDIPDHSVLPYIEGADVWNDPETGEELSDCPFLREDPDLKCSCAIYETRPRDCRVFPSPRFNMEGELIKVHPYALDSCPGFREFLSNWTKADIQHLKDNMLAQDEAERQEELARIAESQAEMRHFYERRLGS